MLLLLNSLTAFFLLLYLILIRTYQKYFQALKTFSISPSLTYPVINQAGAPLFFSILIPARNEEENIGNCLAAVCKQNFPSEWYEVIIINDHSTDRTEAIVKAQQAFYPNLRLLNLADFIEAKSLNAYKKKAIEMAAKASKGNWIITTDADCTMGPNWLKAYAEFIAKQDPVFVAAPVSLIDVPGWLPKFQLLDFLSLQGITAAAIGAGLHTMCNGANIAYDKSVFYEVGQFEGIDQIASGDDMLLMQKIKKSYPHQIGYLFCKEAIVRTSPMLDIKSFLHQRIRWASKADKYKDPSIFWILLLVYLLNFFLLVLLMLCLIGKGNEMSWLFFMALKTGFEWAFLFPVANFFDQKKSLAWFPFFQPLHLLYTVIAGWLGKFGSYQWKERKVK